MGIAAYRLMDSHIAAPRSHPARVTARASAPVSSERWSVGFLSIVRRLFSARPRTSLPPYVAGSRSSSLQRGPAPSHRAALDALGRIHGRLR